MSTGNKETDDVAQLVKAGALRVALLAAVLGTALVGKHLIDKNAGPQKPKPDAGVSEIKSKDAATPGQKPDVYQILRGPNLPPHF